MIEGCAQGGIAVESPATVRGLIGEVAAFVVSDRPGCRRLGRRDVDVEAGTADGLRRSPSFRRARTGGGDRMSGRVRDRISCLQISLQDLELILPRWYTKSTVYAIDTEWMRRRLEHSVTATWQPMYV